MEELIEKGTAVGVDRFVVQSVATAPKQVASINGFIADAVAASNGRFIGFGTLHPESEDIKGDLEHLTELGLKGVKLHPDIQGFKLDDYRCLKIYELCEAAGLPILMHTGDFRYDMSNPNRLIPVMKIYTNLTVIGAHFGGWSLWEEASDRLSDFPNFYVDTCSSFYALEKDTVKRIIEAYGTDKVIFGTDYPMWRQDKDLEYLFSLGFFENELQNILYNNILKALKIKNKNP